MVSIIDDDQSFRESVVDLVRAMGFEAQEFERAEDFLHSGGTARTACLITDMRMPGMSGLELHERLTARNEAIPTIVITAFPKDDDRARAQRNGVIRRDRHASGGRRDSRADRGGARDLPGQAARHGDPRPGSGAHQAGTA